MPFVVHATTVVGGGFWLVSGQIRTNVKLVFLLLLLGYAPDTDILWSLALRAAHFSVPPILDHRGFTHSLVGAFILAMPVRWLALKLKLEMFSLRICYFFILGHVILDFWAQSIAPWAGLEFSNLLTWFYWPGSFVSGFQTDGALRSFRKGFDHLPEHFLKEFTTPTGIAYLLIMLVVGFFWRNRSNSGNSAFSQLSLLERIKAYGLYISPHLGD